MPDALERRFEDWLRDLAAVTERLTPSGERVDLHVHAGVDAGSGLEMTFGAIDHQLSAARVGRALLIPLNASDGYHRDNLRLVARAAERPDRFSALYRIDPRDPDLAAHVAEGFAAGAAGLKLHPFSDQVSPTDPRIAPALELANEQRAIVLVHTGVEVEHASADTVEAARRYPEVRFVFGHLPADRLVQATRAAAELDNVFTCLSWWGAHDVSLALTFTDPARVVVGTDPPYGNVVVGFTQAVRVARALGMDDAAVRAIIGGTATGLLAKAPLAPVVARDIDLAAPDLLTGLPLPFRRCYLALLAATTVGWKDGDAASYVGFARSSLEPTTIAPELADATDELRRSIELMGELYAGGLTAQGYAVGTGALTQALTTPYLD